MLGTQLRKLSEGAPTPMIGADVHRALIAFCSRAHLESALRQLWAHPPCVESEGACEEWPIADRLWALYGALRFGCVQPPIALRFANSQPASVLDDDDADIDGWNASPDDDFAGRALRSDDMCACISLVLLAASSGASASWPAELLAQADALRASAGRQLVLPALAAGNEQLASVFVSYAFGPAPAEAQSAPRLSIAGAQGQVLPLAAAAEGSPTSAGVSPATTLPPSDPSQPGGSGTAGSGAGGHGSQSQQRTLPPPPGSEAAIAAAELRALLEACASAGLADESGAPRGSGGAEGSHVVQEMDAAADGEGSPGCGCETQWATQAGAGAFGGAFGFGAFGRAEPSSAADSQEESERNARRARSTQDAAKQYGRRFPPLEHLALQAAFLDRVREHLPDTLLETRAAEAVASAAQAEATQRAQGGHRLAQSAALTEPVFKR